MRRKKRTDEAGKYHKTLREQIRENRALAAVYIVLRALVAVSYTHLPTAPPWLLPSRQRAMPTPAAWPCSPATPTAP